MLESLQEMDSYGEYDGVSRGVSEVSLIAVSSGMYYGIEIEELRNIGHELVDIIESRALPYPDQEEL